MSKSDKHHIELFETRENATEAFESAKQTFDFITAFIHFPIIFPSIDSIGLGWHDRHKTKVEREYRAIEIDKKFTPVPYSFSNIAVNSLIGVKYLLVQIINPKVQDTAQ